MRSRALSAGLEALVLAGGLALFTGEAAARLSSSASVVYLDWREHIEPLGVHEGGALLSGGVRYEGPEAQRLRWAYDGRISIGWAQYDGAYLDDRATRATGASEWLATAHEMQIRSGVGGGVDGAAGLVLEAWRRRLGSRQQETYRVASARLGIEGRSAAPRALVAGGGLELPLWMEENAHFIELGFDQNPTLRPGRRVGAFARVAYRLDDRWTWIATWDLKRLGSSGGEALTRNGRPVGETFQPETVMHTIGIRVDCRIARTGR